MTISISGCYHKYGYLVIIEFNNFASLYKFYRNGDDFRNKEIIQGVKVRDPIDMCE